MGFGDAPRGASEWERLATNLRVEDRLLPLLDILDGLPVVVFKGAILTRLIYGDLRARASADNDIWVGQGRAAEALSRLEALDYRPLPGLNSRLALRRVGQVALWRGGNFEEVSVDLHAEPFSSRYFNVSEPDLLPHLLELELHGRTLVTFDRPLALAHMVAHWVQHHLDRSHLPHIRDAWDAWSTDLAEGKLLTLADKTCTRAAMEAALRLAAPHLPLPTAFTHNPSRRARFVCTVIAANRAGIHPLVAKFLTLFLVDPARLPQGIFNAAILDHDDLVSRYGQQSRTRLLARHLWRSLLG